MFLLSHVFIILTGFGTDIALYTHIHYMHNAKICVLQVHKHLPLVDITPCYY